jgi:hypothetical protein
VASSSCAVCGAPGRARSSQVSTMACCPARRSRIASAISCSTASQAGGAPSLPCRSACARCLSGDSTQATSRTSYRCVADPARPAGGLAPAGAPSGTARLPAVSWFIKHPPRTSRTRPSSCAGIRRGYDGAQHEDVTDELT